MLTPAIYRKLIHPLVWNKFSYPFGMVLVRLSRNQRKKIGKNYTGGPEMSLVSNFAGNLKMSVDKYSYMGGSIYWSGYHHLNELLYLKKVLKEDMVFADIGANQGEFTIFAASILKKGKVLAFEPVSSNLSSLRTNVELNQFDNVEVIPKGLFYKNETLPVYTSLDPTLNGGRHEGLSTIFPDDYRNVLEEKIELIPFDENFYDQIQRLDVVKIDVEGAELHVFKGMMKTLDKFHPQILIELNVATARNAGYEVKELVDLLTNLGYKSYKIFRGNPIEQDWTDEMIWDNFLFKHRN